MIGVIPLAKRSLKYFVGLELDSIEGFLKSMQSLCAIIVGVGVFYKLVKDKIYSEGWGFIFSEHALPNILITVLFMRFYFSMQSVRFEMDIGRKLFSPGRIPKQWAGPKDKLRVAVSVIAFALLYLALTWATDYIWASSFIMLIIASIDLHTRYFINRRMKQAFSDPRYAPDQTDRDYHLIKNRRQEAILFLFEKPHLKKEAACVTGCGIACILAAFGYFKHSELMNVFAYLVLILALVVNEIFSQIWRSDLFRRLEFLETA